MIGSNPIRPAKVSGTVGQRSGRSAVNAEIVGFNSHQSRQDSFYGSVAQWSELLPLKQEVVG